MTASTLAETNRTGVADALKARLSLLYDVILRDDMREGRLSLVGLRPPRLVLATAGLVAVVALLGSLIVNDAWRQGALLAVSGDEQPIFLPAALFPVTVVALWLSWLLLLLGAALASAWVQVATALAFLVVNGTIGRPVVVSLSDAVGLRFGAPVVRGAYLVCAGLLLVLAAAAPWDWLRRRFRPVVVVGLAASCTTMFAALLWVQAAAVAAGQPTDLPTQLSGTVLQLSSLLLPLVFLSQLALVDFSYSLSAAVVVMTSTAGLRLVRALFVLLVVGKLGLQIVGERAEWADYLSERTGSVVRTAVSLAFLALVAMVARRLRAARRGEVDTERLLSGASVALAAPVFLMHFALAATLITGSRPVTRFSLNGQARCPSG